MKKIYFTIVQNDKHDIRPCIKNVELINSCIVVKKVNSKILVIVAYITEYWLSVMVG